MDANSNLPSSVMKTDSVGRSGMARRGRKDAEIIHYSSANFADEREKVFNTLSRSYGREPAGISHYRDMMGGQVRIILHLRRRLIQWVAQEWLAEGV